MNLVEFIFTLLKIALAIGFCMGVGGALTWNDRRMSAMMQDRIGPNRAVFLLPAPLAYGMFAGPALLAGAAVAAWGFLLKAPEAEAAGRILLCSELSVLVLWVGLAILTGLVHRTGPANGLEKLLGTSIKDPRSIFYAGLVAHAAVLVARFALSGTSLGAALKPALLYATPALLALLVIASGAIAAARVPKEGYPLRLIGLLHTAADGLKMIFKEDFIPKSGDRLLHALAPMLALFPPLVVFAVIPFGDVLCFATDPSGNILLKQVLPMVSRNGICPTGAIPMQIADLDMGILFIFAVAGMGVIGAALAGWASDNKYSLLGGLRAAGQMVSYEVTLGLTLVGAFMIYGTLRLDNMVRWQGDNAWGIFVQPVAFVMFFIAAIAETKRIPFDLPEGESEIIGYFVEYSGMKFGMFYFAEYIEVVTSSALLVTLFLGGWNLPFLHRDGLTVALGDAELLRLPMSHLSVVLLQVVTFFGKVLAMCWLQAVIRWTLPRFRYDQLMKLCWRGLFPLSLANIVLTAIVLLVVQNTSPAVQSGLQVAADITQLAIGLAMAGVVVAGVIWLLKPIKREPRILSSTAEMVARQGRTPTAAMQA